MKQEFHLPTPPEMSLLFVPSDLIEAIQLQVALPEQIVVSSRISWALQDIDGVSAPSLQESGKYEQSCRLYCSCCFVSIQEFGSMNCEHLIIGKVKFMSRGTYPLNQ